MTYTHTRISREYLAKLQALAVRNKRSATKQLEVLIDKELNRTANQITKGRPEIGSK